MGEGFNELRWNPLLGTWVVVSSKRRGRPWRSEACPFCPGSSETGHGWRVLTLDNKYPALRPDARTSRSSRSLYEVRPAYGHCKVVVESPQHEGDLSDLLFEDVKLYVLELVKVTLDLCSDPNVQCVIPFRNKGEVIGVSLTHPHSQVYALPFVAPRIRREMESMERHWREEGECLLCRILRLELEEGARVLYSNASFVAFLPFFAMWPYEVHVYPKRHFGSLLEIEGGEVEDLADALKVVTAMYNSLFDFSLPYMMVFHQKPCRASAEYFHFHIEFYPVHRERDKLKYAAGVEWGAWTFTYDSLPEEKASDLRAALARGLERLRSSGYEARGGSP